MFLEFQVLMPISSEYLAKAWVADGLEIVAISAEKFWGASSGRLSTLTA